MAAEKRYVSAGTAAMTANSQSQPCLNSFPSRLSDFRKAFDPRFSKAISDAQADTPQVLIDAMHYSALAPGKRLRPYLVVRCCELSGGRREEAWPAAMAIECIHAFSLVHDDLPAMDDDDVRRGQPTCHKQFGEALAILAGDALVALAFELLASDDGGRDFARAMVLELARATGRAGMIAGQVADMAAQPHSTGALPPSSSDSPDPHAREFVETIHRLKTARLFAGACRLGALAGRAEGDLIEQWGRFGELLGRAFQISDDLLDVTAKADVLGKAVGKDEQAGKPTIVGCLGIEESRKLASRTVEEALALVGSLAMDADDLKDLCRFVIDRNY